MRAKPVLFKIDTGSPTPVALQVVEGIKRAIRQGRLRAGDVVPSTRPFADSLGVSRNTVLEAYQELTAEGVLVARRGSGSFVADPLPAGFKQPGRGARRDALAFTLTKTLPDESLPASGFSCRTGQVDPRLLPALALARSYRKAMESSASMMPRQRDSISEGRLKQYIAELLEQTAGIAGTPENLLLVNGFEAALHLVAGALVEPGDKVAVEALGARRHWGILRQAGAILEPIDVDNGGLSVEALIKRFPQEVPRAVLVSPRCQYPTTVALAPGRRRALMEWALEKGVAILECDAESGIQFGAQAPLPLASEDPGGSVVYFGAFGKTISPGLPLAYIQGPRPFIAHLAGSAIHQELGSDPVFEGVVTDFFLEGAFDRHLARLRATLLQRRNALDEALKKHLGSHVDYTLPETGMALWIRVRDGLDVDQWAERAVRQGVAFSSGRRYRFDGAPTQAIRLGFASHNEDELDEIVRRMAAAL